MSKRKPLLLVLVLVLAVAGLWYFFKSRQDNSSETTLTISGTIEVTEVRLGFRIPGMLIERVVEEGDRIESGQLLARLDSSDQHLAVAQAEANLQLASALLAELEAGSRRQEIEAARATFERAEAAEQAAETRYRQHHADYQRYQTLYQQGGVSQTDFEAVQTLRDTALHARDEARAGREAAAQQLELTKLGPRQEHIEQARAKLALAAATLKQAQQQLAYTDLVAPLSGIVLSTAAEAGEYLNPSLPVLTVGALDRPWLRAYVNETDLGKIRLNQPVSVRTDSFPDHEYTGVISAISDQAEFTPKTVQTFEERVKLMYRIKVLLENRNNELKPGMPADGSIDLANR